MESSPRPFDATERVLALLALRDAVAAELKVAQRQLVRTVTGSGAMTVDTPASAAAVVTGPPTLSIDDAALLDWVRENASELVETVERVPDWYAAQLTDPATLIVTDGPALDGTGRTVANARATGAGATFVHWPEQLRGRAARDRALPAVHAAVAAITLEASDAVDV
ncbi:hypothetical protein [Rathayibacter rathayi]|uniref:Uncharacterized protein n=1 Tax=Rathayibacter rathayi TaxID=33887 RepID=A0ABX5AH11_RATRA|nr:hypothetical protein [Rathayibacter rathayi]PPF23107.1 hypothetical protein C5C34_09770 [Rathayibacter rathayi]PPF51625.1 hypothetical protein C5C08_02130 [Rathayibacter rathayi]PPF83215.1 hypothetical protein C5C14_02165 [Rathayibacter rathayi]PPG47046.1 hypothetical protein C5C20_02125 [Rathayibacter rathayi]PPG94069.1 hypothetical protein C5C22_09640 [Rathayibacter rathayi]